jgi:hypothetical protein
VEDHFGEMESQKIVDGSTILDAWKVFKAEGQEVAVASSEHEDLEF